MKYSENPSEWEINQDKYTKNGEWRKLIHNFGN